MPRLSDSVRAAASPRGHTTSDEETARVEVPENSIIREIKISGTVLAKGKSDKVGIVSSINSEYFNLQVQRYGKEGISTDSDTVRLNPDKFVPDGRTIEATAKTETSLKTHDNWYNDGEAEVTVEVKYEKREDSEEPQDSDQDDSSEDGSGGQESSSDSGRKAQMVLAGGILLGGVLLWQQ